MEAAAANTASTNVIVKSGRQVQTSQRPVAPARKRAPTQKNVVHIVARMLKNNALELRAGATTRQGNGSLRDSQVLQSCGVVGQTSEPATRLSAYAGKQTARQNLAVCLNRNCINQIAFIRIERISEARHGIKPGDAVARLSADAAETTARQNLAVRLEGEGKDLCIRIRVKRISQSGRRIEPGDVVARLSADAVRSVEMATHQNLAVRLHRD